MFFGEIHHDQKDMISISLLYYISLRMIKLKLNAKIHTEVGTRHQNHTYTAQPHWKNMAICEEFCLQKVFLAMRCDMMTVVTVITQKAVPLLHSTHFVFQFDIDIDLDCVLELEWWVCSVVQFSSSVIIARLFWSDMEWSAVEGMRNEFHLLVIW